MRNPAAGPAVSQVKSIAFQTGACQAMSCEVARAAGLAKALITGCVVGAAMVVAHAASASDLRHSPSSAARTLEVDAASRVRQNSARNERHRPRHPHPAAPRSERLRPVTTATAVGESAAPAKPKADFTGRRRLGIASFYADNFGGKPMADGVPMNLEGNNAASRTLPLGTKAKVTNLETGQERHRGHRGSWPVCRWTHRRSVSGYGTQDRDNATPGNLEGGGCTDHGAAT